jgi:hypothetical protein
MECQRFQCICRGSEITREAGRVNSYPKVLLADGGQSALEYASLTYEKHAEVSFTEGRSIHR